MTALAVQIMELDSQKMRGRFRVAHELGRLNKTAKQIAGEVLWATGENLDIRTVQKALGGESCSFDTFLALAQTYGWRWAEAVLTPKIGAGYIEALEREIARERAAMDARDARLDQLKGARRARDAVHGGELRLVAPESDEARS